MGKILINDDDAMEIMDYLIKKDDSYAEYMAETMIYPKLGIKRTYLEYARGILNVKIKNKEKHEV